MKKHLVVLILSLIVLSFPAAICFADNGFQVDIDTEKMTVHASGTDTHLITKNERDAFGITDGPLKQAVKKYWGKAPNDAYLLETSRWGGLYKTYGWPQVQTTVKVIDATMTHTAPQIEHLAIRHYSNQTKNKGSVNVKFTETVTNTQSHTWSKSNAVTVLQSVNYGIKVKGSTSLSYTHQWGESATRSQSITAGTDAGMTVDMDPGDKFTAELVAYKSNLTITIRYLATVNGDTAINYNPTYKGPGQSKAHHFYHLPINGVMSAAGIPTTKEITETITICNYSDANIMIKDDKTGAIKHNLKAILKH